MKNVLIILVLSLFSISLQSQDKAPSFVEITVTPNGLRNANDPEKTYVVVHVDSLTAQELYTNAKRYVEQIYKNPDFVSKGDIAGEYLRFSTFFKGITRIKNPPVTLSADIEYDVEMYFKDSKVRIEFISVKPVISHSGANILWKAKGLNFHIWSKKGKLKQKKAKDDIERYFNVQLNNIALYLKGNGKIVDEW